MNRFFNLFRREKLSAEISCELDFHLAERTDELIARGIPRRDAEKQAAASSALTPCIRRTPG
jgi:hypothetical protein